MLLALQAELLVVQHAAVLELALGQVSVVLSLGRLQLRVAGVWSIRRRVGQDLGLDDGLLGLGALELGVGVLLGGFAFGLADFGFLGTALQFGRSLGFRALLVTLHLLDDVFLVHQAAGVDQHAVGDHHAHLAQGHGLLELAVFQGLAARHGADHHVVLAQGQVVDDLACRGDLVHGEGLGLARGLVVGDRHDALFGVELLHQIEDVARQDVVGARQAVHRLGQVRCAGLALGLDGLGSHVLAVEALGRVRYAGDRLDVLFGLVGDAVQAGGHLVGLDLLDVVDVGDLDYQPGLGALLFQLFHGHVREAASLHLPAAVGCGVDDVQLLAGDLVQQLLGAQQVLDQADRCATAEVGEVRHHGEVLVGAPVVVQAHVVGDDRPADAAHELGRDLQPVLARHQGDLVAVEVVWDGAHVARGGVDEMFLAVQQAVLALDQADVAHHRAVVIVARVHRVEPVAEPVTEGLDAVVAVGEEALLAVAQVFGVLLVVEHRDVVCGDPLGREHLTPAVRVVLFAVRVDDDVLGVQVVDDHLALHAVAVADAHVQEAARGDGTVGEHVAALPVELVVVADLLEDLGEDVGDLTGGPGARPEARLGPVEDLLAQHVADRGEDLVDRQRRAAHGLQAGLVGAVPLVAPEEGVTLLRFLHELGMAVVTGPTKTRPDFCGECSVNRHGGGPARASGPPCR